MKTSDIRSSYLEFFAGKGHTIVPSDSLVPANDPTLLFTGAGMNQFKENFLGLRKDLKRATSSQKCLRTADLEEVGRTAFHHSFFEMLGNFSFGDYFKEEAIYWAWDYLTKTLRIPPARLRVSVHESDGEAFQIWKDKIGIRENWIYRLGDKSNFWPANAPAEGPNGPCGPCSEIYYDQDPQGASESLDSPRFAEIWNLVFTQYNRVGVQKLEPLSAKNIDTGMGLERLACVLQGKKTNYEIDLFTPILSAIEATLGITKNASNERAFYAIADHLRAAVFCMVDGALPGNEGRGYVVRKLIRRALWHASRIHPLGRVEAPVLHGWVRAVGMAYQTAYPEILQSQKSISTLLESEESRFLDTLEKGLRILSQKLDGLESQGLKKVPGDVVFELYDTYGFPEELTRIVSQTRGFSVDAQGFEQKMEEQRQKAKASSQIADAIFVSSGFEEKIAHLSPSRFTGYDAVEGTANILWIEKKAEGLGVLALDATPFYAEGGGQVGDRGILEGAGSAQAEVLDTQKKLNIFLHSVRFLQGDFKTGDRVVAKIDIERRRAIMRNHTATHLLHAALRSVLGSEVRQLGSLVAAEKLRFDFSFSRALTDEEIQKVESLVNAQILSNEPVHKEEKDLQSARSEGALAFFGEKYADKVRVVSISTFSKELCGGTHCRATGDIGLFMITSESSVASGTRRIEALTGSGALTEFFELRALRKKLGNTLKVAPGQIEAKILQLQKLAREVNLQKNLPSAAVGVDMREILASKETLPKGHLVAFSQKGSSFEALREASDKLRSEKKIMYFLATEGDGKVQFLLGMSKDLLSDKSLELKPIFNGLAPLLGISGGGRPDLIQGGGADPARFFSSWPDAVSMLRTKMSSQEGR